METKREPRTITFYLVNLTFLATLFPYLSPLPLETDVQPIAFLLALLSLFSHYILDRKQLVFNRQDVIILTIALIYLVYANATAWEKPVDVIRKTSAMLLGFFIFLISKYTGNQLSKNVLLFAAIGHASAALLQTLSPELHSSVIKPFLGSIRTSDDRGVGGACNEPSFLANIAILLPIAAMMIKDKFSKVDWLVIWICILTMIFTSQAGTATGYGLIVLIVFGLTRSLKSAIITTVCATTILFCIPTFDSMLPSNRSTEIIKVGLSDPKLIIEDPSASMRLVGHYLSVPSLREAPLGTGDISLNNSYFWFLWNKYNIDSWYTIEVSRLSGQYYALGYGLTDVGSNCLRMGFVFVGILGIWFSQYLTSRNSVVVLVFVMIGVLSSIPIIFPAYWLLLGLCAKKRPLTL
jgi:hypothetical protein